MQEGGKNPDEIANWVLIYTVKKEVAILKKADTSKSFSNNYLSNTKITLQQSQIQ